MPAASDPVPPALAESAPTDAPPGRDPARGLTVAALAGCSAVALALRILQARQDLFGDELSTFWIVTTRSLADVIETVRSNAEISPPLSFVVTWLTTRAGVSPGWLRAGSVLAGTATVPLLYVAGVRSVGRAGGLVAAAIAAFAPFQIYYSGEARGYAVLMALVLLSTASLLRAVDGGARWAWGMYALSITGAVYTHYTCVFVLAAQAPWLWWAHPETRRTSLLVHGAATVAFLPWFLGFLADLRSPTLLILSALQPFDREHVGLALAHATVGHPYHDLVSLDAVPGTLALVLLALGVGIAVVGAGLRRRSDVPSARRHADRRDLLVVALALATPVGAAFLSAVGSTTLFGARNLAASWPGFALALGMLAAAPGPRLRLVSSALVVASFALGAVAMLDPRHERPHVSAAAAYIEQVAAPGDVVIDQTIVSSPGPLSHLDPVSPRGLVLQRSGGPASRDHPFTVFDPVVTPEEAARRAAERARGGRIFAVTYVEGGPRTVVPPGYRLREEKRWPGLITIVVQIYESEAPASSRG